ncbi:MULTISPECIES: DUF1127 domain-containing protein [unclassified Sinorhizobium]|uniref:DUF1127 domain-containing protein n=1 Tax=unclassified Sinorhizobium TaxID=2613772 RepID=UPI0024C3C5EE|nr:MULTISPECIES: DUF1127 domain-containing protein [unclassified Sinorhizobium]MDK1374550.1 DUF1127 domain-containing protein [Sinorhizobium sp. 6-70]MDK1478251.1 DUF1127 domain-containing protein [Sinorhizobium sp. 6-117]
MNQTFSPAPAPHQAVRPGTRVELADVSRRHLATLRGIIATWDKRIRFRWELEQKSKDDPHLIDDIGLTRHEVEAEIAKPFWQR